MSEIKEVLGIVLPIFTLVYLGFLFRHVKMGRGSWFNTLNLFVYYVSLPAVVISSFWQIDILDPLSARTAGLNLLLLLMCAAAFFAILQALVHASGRAKASIFMVGLVGNTVYLGFPLIHRAFGAGEAALGIAAAALHLAAGLIFSIMAVEYWVVKSRKPLVYAKDFVKNPLFISLALGIIISLIKPAGEVYEAVQKPLSMLGQTASPLALFALGGFLHGKFLREHLRPALLLAGLKLAILPLVFWASLNYLGAGRGIAAVSALAAAMPAAVTAFVLAEKYNLDHELVANTILISTGLSVFTISLLLVVVK